MQELIDFATELAHASGRLILDEDFDKVKATHQASLEDIFVRLVAGA